MAPPPTSLRRRLCAIPQHIIYAVAIPTSILASLHLLPLAIPSLHSSPTSTQQCNVCTTDRQRRRSLSLKPVKASSANRQRALGAHRLKQVREKGKNDIAPWHQQSPVMQDLKKPLTVYCNHESFLNRDTSMFHCYIGRKLNLILKLKVVMLNE